MNSKDIETIELDLLIEAIRRRYGYDFREYNKETMARRISHNLSYAGLNNISELIPRILKSKASFERLFYDISITVTEMFRDPRFYVYLRQKVIPVLKTYPFIKVWHAGCASGQEVYSLAIVLQEEGCYDKTQIYATDINDAALAKARAGIYQIENIKKYITNYQQAGGRESFADYFHANYNSAIMNASLKRNVTFANHNLVTDGVFGEMHLIFCRNVLIYFNKPLQEQVFDLFYESLCRKGFLCLGSKESLSLSFLKGKFCEYDPELKIYQKSGDAGSEGLTHRNMDLKSNVLSESNIEV
ncbi:MAG: protein-glutamate O-methyltransferase CheR [Sedimentisphaerales bacterium]|nr:protein-glutamate O-methyltransferase CheR [Sedimentisphaerales bacterium]